MSMYIVMNEYGQGYDWEFQRIVDYIVLYLVPKKGRKCFRIYL